MATPKLSPRRSPGSISISSTTTTTTFFSRRSNMNGSIGSQNSDKNQDRLPKGGTNTFPAIISTTSKTTILDRPIMVYNKQDSSDYSDVPFESSTSQLLSDRLRQRRRIRIALIRGVLFGSNNKSSSEDHSDTGTVATLDMASLELQQSYSDRSLSMEIPCHDSHAATCSTATTADIKSHPLEEQELPPHRSASLEETKVEEKESQRGGSRHQRSTPQVPPTATIMPSQDALHFSSDPSCHQSERTRASSESTLPPTTTSPQASATSCSSRRAVSCSTLLLLEPVKEEDLVKEQQDMHAIMAIMNKAIGFQPKHITPLKVTPSAAISSNNDWTIHQCSNVNLLPTMEQEMQDILEAMKQPMGVKPVEVTVIVPTRKEPEESTVTMAADTVSQDDDAEKMLLSSEFEEMKSIMSALQKSIGFKPVDIHRCSTHQSNSTTTAPEDRDKETAATESDVEALRLSNEFGEMKDIMAALRKSIGFQPVEINGVQSKPIGYRREISASSPNTTMQDAASLLKTCPNVLTLSLTMDDDDESVDSRLPEEEEEDSDGDDDDSAISDTKRYRTISKALNKAIRSTEDHDDFDDDEPPASTKPELPRRSLLPGRPETVMSSGIRDFLRRQVIVNTDGVTSSDTVDPQGLNKEVNPTIAAYVNRRKAVEEHSILIESEHARVQQRLADLKAKRLAQFRAKKAAASQATRAK